MKLFLLLLAFLMSLALLGCGGPKQQQVRDDDQIRRNADQAHNQDLQQEEDKKPADEEDE
jgi:outer membrane biogenesis lipoprotein LolB